MEASSISNDVLEYGNHYTLSGYKEDYQMGEHFWNLLTKSESKATYNAYEEADVQCVIDAHYYNDFEGSTVDEATEVEDGIDTDEVRGYIDTSFHEDAREITPDYSHIEIPDYSYIESPRSVPTYYSNAKNMVCNSTSNIDYTEFIKATNEGNWSIMKKFIGPDYPDALTMKKFHDNGTALHLTLHYGHNREDIAECLVNRMTAKDLEIEDKESYTPLALAAFYHHSDRLLECMIDKNPNLPNIGKSMRIPVVVASSKGFTKATKFLYPFTDEKILCPEYQNARDSKPSKRGRVGVNLLNLCINIKLFGIAKELVEKFPEIIHLEDDENRAPIHALAKAMSAIQSLIQQKKSSGWLSNFGNCILKGEGNSSEASHQDQELTHKREAYELLRLIISFANPIKSLNQIHHSMMEASKHGNIEFITEILKVDRELIHANLGNKNMFWHAIINRHEKVFNLIYGAGEMKDKILSFIVTDEDTNHKDKVFKIYGTGKEGESLSFVVKEEDNTKDGSNSDRNKTNILHIAAKLPPPSVLERISTPALQMQREVQWFQAVSDLAKSRYRDDLNKSGLTPYALFTQTHKDLLDAGEKSMKKTASSATTVSALIITTMFAAAFAVISGEDQIQHSDPSFITKMVFITFIVFDALALCSSTTSILVFLGILAARYSQEDFLVSLPRKFIYGFIALFCSITTMMLAFCCALFVMIKGGTHYVIIPIFGFSLVPVVVFILLICPFLWNIYRSTNKSIFDKSTRLPSTGLKGVVDGCY